MKYMINWFERPQGSPAEYENAQKRILEVFTQWTAPDNFKIEMFVVRVGDWGGYMLVDCEDPLRLFFYEEWADRPALDTHFAEPGSEEFMAAVRALAQASTRVKILPVEARN